MKKRKITIAVAISLLVAGGLATMSLCYACGSKQADAAAADTLEYQEIASFNGDSAFNHVSAQVEFGPRVPGTDSHEACLNYIVSNLKRYGADTLILDKFEATAFTGDVLPLTNITARFNKQARRRILLAAHWDTRPWGDHDTNSQARKLPIPGANDGGSGVAVLLEIARNLQIEEPEIGVDMVLFDGEDYGDSSTWGNSDDTWCLGSQHWVTTDPYKDSTVPMYGIVFDMVGGRGARFHREHSSDLHNKEIVDKVWDLARRSGHGDRFVNARGGNIIDDHLAIINTGVPAIVIIENNNPNTQSFNPTWHTQSDDTNNVSRRSLKAAGQTVLNLIYEESIEG